MRHSEEPPLSPTLISIDWGTSSLRAYLVAGDGRVIERRDGPKGILAVEDGRFADILRATCRDWIDRAGRLPVVLSGMIGSRQGWIEAPYVAGPAGPSELAAALVPVTVDGFGPIRLVPGILVRSDGVPDVMRGEECQILGALVAMGRTDGTLVLPGTHSKHAVVVDGAIVGFRTYMTGEAFAALRQHTILGRMMAGSGDGSGFDRGVDAAAGRPLLHAIFGARTLRLMDELAESEAADYLSGLLIAHELTSLPAEVPAIVIGADDLVARYRRAAGRLGRVMEAAPPDCVATGHLALARQAGLLAG